LKNFFTFDLEETLTGQLEVRDTGAMDLWAKERLPNIECISNSLSFEQFSLLSESESDDSPLEDRNMKF